MKQSAFALLISASSALPLLAVAQQPTSPEAPPAIVVSAEGKRTMTPDRASVFLSVLNRGRTPTAAGAENARIATAIRNAVQALGVDRAQISTLNYNVQPDIDIIQGPQGRETRRDSAYIATNTVRVEIRNLDLVSRVIDTSLTAGAENARIATAIRNAVQALGVDWAQISTLNYNVQPDIDIIQGPQGRETRRDSAYIATNTVRVEIRNLDLVSRVIDTSLTAGATNVMSVSYWLSDLTRARREATVDAVRVARDNAEAIATAAGGSLGDLIEITTQPVRILGQQMEAPMYRMDAAMAAAAPTPVSPREIDVTAYVTARWKFVKGTR